MLDVKVLAAVLVSLAAFGMLSGGDTMSFSDPSELVPKDLNGIGPRSIGAFIGVLNDDGESEEVYAKLNINESKDQEFSLQASEMAVEGLESVSLDQGTVDSDSSIRFLNFTGDVRMADESRISGSASTIVTSGVNLTGSYDLEEKVRTSGIDSQGAYIERLTLEKMNGVIESGSTSSRLEKDTELSLREFRGDIHMNPVNGTVIFDGTVASLDAGTVSIG